MYSYLREQKEFKIGRYSFGGPVGKNSFTLFGTLFYGKNYKVIDEDSLELAGMQLAKQDELMELTGVQSLVDVYIKDDSKIESEIDFMLEHTDDPFSIDSSDPGTRAKTLKYLSEQGVLDRIVYNSVNLGITTEELSALEEYTPDAAIVLAYNPRDMSVDGRVDILKTGAGMLSVEGKGLMELSQDLGIEKLFIDTGATPFGSMSAETMRAIPVMKNTYGLPTGCSIHNTLESWIWMKDYRKDNRKSYDCANAAANAMVSFISGDFTVYGPLSVAEDVFPSVAFAEKLKAEGAVDYFGTEISEFHPYYKLE